MLKTPPSDDRDLGAPPNVRALPTPEVHLNRVTIHDGHLEALDHALLPKGTVARDLRDVHLPIKQLHLFGERPAEPGGILFTAAITKIQFDHPPCPIGCPQSLDLARPTWRSRPQGPGLN